MRLLIITLFCLGNLIQLAAFGQSTEVDCEKIFESVDKRASYGDNQMDLLKFFTSEIAPILNEYRIKYRQSVNRLYLTLTINKKGQVKAVESNLNQLPIEFQKRIEEKCLQMNNWYPAEHNGFNVCSKYTWPINCIKWN